LTTESLNFFFADIRSCSPLFNKTIFLAEATWYRYR